MTPPALTPEALDEIAEIELCQHPTLYRTQPGAPACCVVAHVLPALIAAARERADLAEDFARVSARLASCMEAATKAHDATCGYCDRPAACFGGMAEGGNAFAFACGECCGHGIEDAWCEPITSKGRDSLRARLAAAEKERDALRAGLVNAAAALHHHCTCEALVKQWRDGTHEGACRDARDVLDGSGS